MEYEDYNDLNESISKFNPLYWVMRFLLYIKAKRG